MGKRSKSARRAAQTHGVRRQAVSSTAGGTPIAAYEASDPFSQELGNWHPMLASADGDWLGERRAATARARDLNRNNGWAAGAKRHEIDTVLGASLRLSYKPDAVVLGLDPDVADEFADRVERRWRTYSMDPDHHCDAARHDTIPGLFALAYGHMFSEGDAIGIPLWRPGRGQWSTSLQIVDPDLLSNPNDLFDTDRLRAGVQLDEYGAATGYWFRHRHENDGYGLFNADAMKWDFLPRETDWGRPRVIHFFEKDRAGQTRGIGRLTPVTEALFMDHRLGRAELQAAVINAILAVVLESPFDPEMVAQGLAPGSDSFGQYQELRKGFHKEKRLTFGGAQISTTFPGEKLNLLSPQHPNANYADFESAILRKAAAGIGTSYEQLTRDWSKTNYSSARAALIEVWRGYIARREKFTQGFCTQFFACWLEEDISLGAYDDLLPGDIPSFGEAKAAWTRCKWIGPARGWVDPTKEAEALGLRLGYQIATMEDESAEQGRDWQEDQDQLAREMRRRRKLGLPEPVYPKQATPTPPAAAKEDA